MRPPWSRTTFQPLWKTREIDCFQLIDVEPVAHRRLKVLVLVEV